MAGKQKTHRVCVICGTRERHCREKLFFAKFPEDENRCKQWLKAVGDEDLVHLPIEKLAQLRHVCGKHFRRKDFTKTGSRLKKSAVPSLNLTGKSITEDSFENFPLHIAKATLRTQQQQQNEDLSVDQPPVSRLCQPEINLYSASTSKNQVLAPNLTAPAGASTEQDMIFTNEIRKRKITEAKESANPVLPPTQKGVKQRKTLGEQNLPNPIVPPSEMRELQFTTEISSLSQLTEGNEVHQNKTSESIATRESRPREKQLIEQLKTANCTIRSLKKNAKLIENIESPLLKGIIEMTVKNQKRKPRGRRWTTKYKISLLAILKRSAKSYRFLANLMPLPSTATLQNILRKVPMEPGVCQQALDYLKKDKQKNELDKYCCLLFDEMALKPRVVYNYAMDKIEGYTDMGDGERSPDMADHALVFMLQGMRKKFKQPIAFYFVKGTVSSAKLATLIQEIILKVHETGYHIMATVCDQGPTNMGALKILKDLTQRIPECGQNNVFKIGDQPVYIIYDVPHLIKSMRNNFLNYGTMKIAGKTARWEHLLKVEEQNRKLLFLSKVSPIHVQPKYRAKMKVKYAAQIFSNTVAAVLKLMATAERDQDEEKKIMETAIAVETIDKLFDYTNGPSGPDDVKKGRRTNVSSKTNHIEVWAEFRKKLETVVFERGDTGTRAKNVRCVQGYITTLLSLRDLWTECQRLGFKYLNLRQLNQDALENLFGILRQHSPTNKNPTVSSFMAGMKTTVISKMTAPHSRGANCQKDSNILLTDFHDLVFEEKENNPDFHDTNTQSENAQNEISTENYPVLSIPEEDEEADNSCTSIDMQPVVYLSGYIVHTILKTHKCDVCAEALLAKNPDDPMYLYIQLREWWQEKKSLTYPSKDVYNFIKDNVDAFETNVIPAMHSLHTRGFTVTIFMANSAASFIKCITHHEALVKSMLTRLAVLLIRRQCARINKSLAILEENVKDAAKKSEQRGLDKNVI